MGATPPNWRVAVKKGDIIAVHATYDVRNASWYESMGIMPLAVTDVPRGGRRPVHDERRRDEGRPDARPPAREQQPRRDEDLGLPRPARSCPTARAARSTIKDFIYSQGDLTSRGAAGRPAVVQRGQSLTFLNQDAPPVHLPHVTSCAAPCTRLGGIAYPLANGAVTFDSAELGTSRTFGVPAAGRDTWQTPTNLSDGTYSYFCRIHPFMRGAFRVKG